MLFITLLLIQSVFSFTVDVGGSRKECFYQELEAGQHVAIYFQVTDGTDISFRMTGPNNEFFAEHVRQQSGVVDKEITTRGLYTMCLDNTYASAGTTKSVTLMMDFSSTDEFANSDQADKVEKLANELNHLLTHARIEVVMLQVKSEMHQNMLESAYSWSSFLFIFQGCLILAMSFIQTYLIKKYFEVKRTI